MSGGPDSKTDLLRTQAHELVKQFIQFDAQDRPEFIFTAPISAVQNTPCTRVQYVYRSASSTQIEKMAESKAQWQASYDIP